MLAGGGVINGDRTINATYATLIPTGSIEMENDEGLTYTLFTVPAGIRVLKVENSYHGIIKYVGVTPGSVHNLNVERYSHNKYHHVSLYCYRLICVSHSKKYNDVNNNCSNSRHSFRISWSPEINTHTPDVTDY